MCMLTRVISVSQDVTADGRVVVIVAMNHAAFQQIDLCASSCSTTVAYSSLPPLSLRGWSCYTHSCWFCQAGPAILLPHHDIKVCSTIERPILSSVFGLLGKLAKHLTEILSNHRA